MEWSGLVGCGGVECVSVYPSINHLFIAVEEKRLLRAGLPRSLVDGGFIIQYRPQIPTLLGTKDQHQGVRGLEFPV